jgi:hypothetical protein
VTKTEINGLECNTPALETLKRNPQANSTNLTDQIVGIALSKCSPRDGLGQEIRPSYAILQSNHDILGLWKLIAHIHTKGKGGSILQIRNAVPEGSEEHGVNVPRVRRRPPITGGPQMPISGQIGHPLDTFHRKPMGMFPQFPQQICISNWIGTRE